MTTINVNVNRPDVQVLDLGVQKENIVEKIVFDISPWIEEYGDGVAYIYARRNGDSEPYPVTLTMEDGKATWTLSSTDTYVKGKGKAQLVYTADSAIKKSRVYPTFVHNSLGAASLTPPDPYDDWLDTLGDYTASIEAAVEDVEDLVGDAQTAKTGAETAQAAAETAQGQAESARNSASNYALTAQSYATGDSNYRSGEATDNAKYYSEEAALYANSANAMASAAAHSYAETAGYATDAGNARLTAEAYATGTREGQPISGTDPAYHNNSKYYAELAEDYADSIDPDTLAKVDGYYDEMSVGNADQLLSSVRETDTEPYGFRTAGGATEIGDRVDFALVGVDVAWNQLVNPTDWGSSSGNGITFTNNGDGTWTVSGTATAVARKQVKANSGYITNHIYLLSGSPSGGSPSTYGLSDSYNLSYSMLEVGGGRVFKSGSGTGEVVIRVDSGVTANNLVFKPQLIDITALFGSTIADYIYSLEQATAGAGVAFFRKYFPKSYYEYNAGSLESANPTAHKTTGFNQWDEVWELGGINSSTGEDSQDSSTIRSKGYIRILPNTTYYARVDHWGDDTNVRVRFYDADKNYIGYAPADKGAVLKNKTFVTPSNAHYMRFSAPSAYGTVYRNDICFNLSWDGSRDGEYEAYKEHTYEIEPEPIHGMMKLEGGKLKADGDVRHADGTVDRNWLEVDLGEQNWTRSSVAGVYYRYYSDVIANAKAPANDNTVGELVSTYTVVSTNGMGEDKTISMGSTGRIYLRDDAYTTASALTTALNGVKLVCKRATPTTDTAEPFTSPQTVDDFGTEEFIDYDVEEGNRDVVIPVGHISEYPANLKAKLEMQPDNPGEEDDYVVSHANGTNSYVPLGGTDTITGIIARLEALESAAGIGGE